MTPTSRQKAAAAIAAAAGDAELALANVIRERDEARAEVERLQAALNGNASRGPSLAPGVTKAPPIDREWDIHCDKCGKQLTQGWSGQKHAGCGGRFLIYGEAKP